MAIDHSRLARELVRAIRGKRSQTALSRRLKYKTNMVYLWEAGRAWPSASKFLNAAERTGIDVFFTEPIADVLGSIAFAAWNIRKRGGEVTYDAFHTVDFIEGHLLQITNADQSRSFAGIYLHASRLYILEATVPKGSPPPGHFQQSLGIFDEKGERVRYNLDADGNRARDYTELPYVDALPNE